MATLSASIVKKRNVALRKIPFLRQDQNPWAQPGFGTLERLMAEKYDRLTGDV